MTGPNFRAVDNIVELLMIEVSMDAKLLLSLPEVLRLIGMGRSWTLLAVKEGRFPKPVALGRARRWLAADVRGWVRDQAAKGAAT
jgi:predicted DNA-binding transcriptional regulator AlpA